MSRIIQAIAEANTVLTEFGRYRCVEASVEWNRRNEQRCDTHQASTGTKRASVDQQNIGEMEIPRTLPLVAVKSNCCFAVKIL